MGQSMTHTHKSGVVRREFLQVGFSGFLGLGLSRLAHAQAGAPITTNGVPRVRSVILVFLTGGPSHHETFDPKPDAPDEIRGEFEPIATSVAGISFSEHLPLLARQAHRLAVVRSMSHGHNNHLNATHQILTGQPQPGAFFDKVASRGDFPCYASALAYLKPREDGTPNGVMLPTFLVEGPLTWPGQHAGFLGPKFDPWQITKDPSRKDFKVGDLKLPEGFSVERLGDRKQLFDAVNLQADAWLPRVESEAFDQDRRKAYSMLLSARVARAFDLNDETDQTRDRYGRQSFGQSLLLSRRLVEAGVPVVQVNMGRVQTWDSHGDIFRRLREDLLPPTDRGVSALIDDLAARGLLEDTLVVVCGEFGRTPKLGRQTPGASIGRDHWPNVFSAVFAGGGVRGGQVIGSSDRVGAYPASRPYGPTDLAATIYAALGVGPDTEVRDILNRPIQLVTGRPIEPLYSGAPT
jgi:Protein of unknown function (DUF1501)